jgi:hypothetical protein
MRIIWWRDVERQTVAVMVNLTDWEGLLASSAITLKKLEQPGTQEHKENGCDMDCTKGTIKAT